jgi:hypothetical protein
VPDLAESDGWLEAPFWVWTAEDPQRRPLYARQSGEEIVITDRHTRKFSLPLTADRDAAAAAERLLDLSSLGVKIRTRALTTTLFARFVLSDLFLHGIGGAKYDQVTDQIARTFFGFALPKFAAVSATLRLPIRHPLGGQHEDPSCAQQLRELRFHPEQYVGRGGSVAPEDTLSVNEIIAAKQRWIEIAKTPVNARERHQAIAAANESLQPFVAQRRRQIEHECEAFRHYKRIEVILRSRDYAFCLYPQRHFEKLL